jgi:ATP-dependent protease ClpP protease subunit
MMKTPKQWYSMKAADKSAEIYVYDEIGSGYFGGVSAKQFVEDLNKIGKVDTINLYINSPGGDVFDGVTIYNALKRNQADIAVHIDGLAASIASITLWPSIGSQSSPCCSSSLPRASIASARRSALSSSS